MEASVVDVDRILRLCQSRCEDMNVGFGWDPHATTAYTDGRTIRFPLPSHPIDKRALDILYGYVIHETGHHLRPDAFRILKAAKPPQHLASLFNITEDDGMERERAGEWRGDRSALERMNVLLLDDCHKNWKKSLTDPKIQMMQEPEPLAAMYIHNMSQCEWAPAMDPNMQALWKMYPDDAKQLTAELIQEGWVEKFKATKTVQDTWDLAVDLAKRLYPKNDEKEYEEIRAAGHSMQGERNDSKSTMPDKVGGKPKSGTPQSSGKAGDKVAQGEESSSVQDGEQEGRCISWKDVVLSDHAEYNDDKRKGRGGAIGITWDGKIPTGGKVQLMPTKDINVMSPNELPMQTRKPVDVFKPKNKATRAFANRVRRYLQSLTRSRIRRGQETGRIDRGALTRLAMPPIDGGEWNKRVFYDQIKEQGRNTAIFVLVDWSGSMQGTKQKHAADAAQRLVYTMERQLKVPVALAAFTKKKTKCDICYIKPWNTRGMTEQDIAEAFARFDMWSNGNNDADSVHWAYQQLLKRGEDRKLLLVLSDGAPSCSWMGHPHDNLRKVVKDIEREGKVEMYGVGILSEAVKNYYTNYKVLSSASDINQTLFELIKDGNNV